VKVKDVGQAIADFDLNNIPKFIKAIGALIFSLTLWTVYLIAKLVTKYWYVCILLVVWSMFEEKVVIWNDPEYYSWYTHIGPISIGEGGFVITGLVIAGFVIARKIVKKLDPVFGN